MTYISPNLWKIFFYLPKTLIDIQSTENICIILEHAVHSCGTISFIQNSSPWYFIINKFFTQINIKSNFRNTSYLYEIKIQAITDFKNSGTYWYLGLSWVTSRRTFHFKLFNVRAIELKKSVCTGNLKTVFIDCCLKDKSDWSEIMAICRPKIVAEIKLLKFSKTSYYGTILSEK